MRLARVHALVLAGAVIATACSDDELRPLSQQESTAVVAMAEAELSLPEQRCLLQGIVDSGIELTTIIDDSLTADQEGELLAVTVECVEDLSVIDAFVDSFIEGAAESGAVLSRQEARCAIRALDSDDVDAEVIDCLGDRLGEADDYGDDAVLDLLWDQCADGNAQACDELYRDAPIGSNYEAYGRSCGGMLPDSVGLRCFEELG